MEQSYNLRNFLFKTVKITQGVITYQDFSKISEDPNNYKSSIFSLSQVLESNLRDNCIGNPNSELSERLYKAFSKKIVEKQLRRVLSLSKSLHDRSKLKAFILWGSKLHKSQKPDEKTIDSYYKDYSSLISASKSQRSSSLSVATEAKQLLSSSSSKPLITSFKPHSASSEEPTLPKSPFNRLYDHAASKEFSLERTRKHLQTKELEECTFRPNVTSSNFREGSVFERLHQSDSKEKDQIYQKQKEFKETKDCTFAPKINSPKFAGGEKTFEKLYKDAEITRQRNMEKELEEKYKQSVECTFRPMVNFSGNAQSGNVYEKLYNDFQEKQRKWRKVQLEGQSKDSADVQFVPKLMSPKNDSGGYTRLYDEAMKKTKEKARRLSEERERSSSASKGKRSEEPPRYEHLYALHKEKQERNAALQDRYLKETGVVFKPNTNKPSIITRKRDFSPKMEYPLPKNPYSDMSSHSSYN